MTVEPAGHVGDALSRARTVEDVAAVVLDLLTRDDGERGAVLHLTVPGGSDLRVSAVAGFLTRADLLDPISLEEALRGRGLFASAATAASVRTLVGTRVCAAGVPRGVLTLARRGGELSGAERTLLEAAAALTGLALEGLRQARRLECAAEQLCDLGKLAAVGQLVAGVAHEVNNPLTTVLGHAQLLLTRPDLGEHVRQRLGLVVSESARAARPIQNLLAFARERAATRQPCSLQDQVRRVLELKGHQLYQDSVQVVTEFGDCPPVRADELEIQHAILALVHRAHRAMRGQAEERVLTVRTRTAGDQVWLDVLDTGPAIAADALADLADPFARPGAAEAGLALAHRVITAHGGRLCGSAVRERGMCFSLVLPSGTPGRG